MSNAKRQKLVDAGDIVSVDNSCSVVVTNEDFVTKEVRTFDVPKYSVFLHKLNYQRGLWEIPELMFGNDNVPKSDEPASQLHNWTLKVDQTGFSVTIYYGKEIEDLVVNCQFEFLSKGKVEKEFLKYIMTKKEAIPSNNDTTHNPPTHKSVDFYYGSFSQWMETTDQLRVIMTFNSPTQLVPSEKVVYGNESCVPTFETFFLSKGLSDISISCNSMKWPAHKIVLAHCSDVFKRMVQTEMKETQEGKIKLDMFDPRAVKEMLRFIYTGKLEAIPEICIDIFKLADTYEIKGLKRQILPLIVNSITVDNSPEMYSFGELYDIKVVKAEALCIAKSNEKRLIPDPETLKKLTDAYPNFIFKLWFKT